MKNRGFIDTTLIITSLLLLGLASALNLVGRRQEIREKSAIPTAFGETSSPSQIEISRQASIVFELK